MCALPLDAVQIGIDGANLRAQTVLLGDTAFEARDIEGGNVEARSSQCIGKATQERDALFDKVQVAVMGCGTHVSGPLIEFVLRGCGVFVEIR
jgi:hypothetical protein